MVEPMMYGVQLRRSMRRLRWAMRARLRRIPALRRHAPLALSLLLNGSVLFVALTSIPPRELRGAPDAPEAVTVFIVPPDPDPAPIEPDSAEAADVEGETPEIDTAQEEQDAPRAPAAETAEATPRPGGRVVPPKVRVPKVDEGRGVPDGIVAIDCDAWFEDPDRAAECAGREVVTNWEDDLQGEDTEKWQRSAEILRRGKARSGMKGPDRFGDLEEGEELFRPEDPRFTPRAPMRRYAEAFTSRQEYEAFLKLQDPRLRNQDDYVGNDYGTQTTGPLSGWRPSWQLRDDPNIDQDALNQFLEEVQE